MDKGESKLYLTKKNIGDIYPMSPMQQGMLFHTLYDPEASPYFEQFCCVIKGDLDHGFFEDAWNHLVDLYPVFRTIFNWKDANQLVQIVLKRRPISLTVIDFKDLDKKARKEAIAKFLFSDRRDSFDLAKGPLMRLTLLQLAPGENYFVWSYHHILFDGWCLSLIMTDFYATYTALKNGQPLPELYRPPYKNYISWLTRQDKEKANRFWSALLSDFDSPTPLPWDRKEPGEDLDIKKITLGFSADTSKKFEIFARHQRITLSTLFQAAWAILLGRYSNTDDIVFGATLSGRPADLKGSEDMVGLFINTLPVRIKFSREMTVAELLNSLQALSIEMREYEYAMLPEVKSCSAVSKSENLFDSIVVFENFPIDMLLLSSDENLSISDIDAVEFTNFDLCLVIAPGDQISTSLSYAGSRFKEKTISRILNHFKTILESLVTDSACLVSGIDIIGQEEKKILLEGFNSEETPFPDKKCIQELIEEQVDTSPERVAITLGKDRITYAEMETRVNQLANFLRARGVGPDMPVGVFMERSIDLVIGVLGIIKAGGAYVPLDTEYPKARLGYMLEDCGADMVLSQSVILDMLPPYKGEVICLDRDREEIERVPDTRPEKINTSRDLVYLVYTSGSTGRPKGIEIEHRGLVNYITWAVEYYDAKGHGSFPLYTSMSFDLTVTSIFVPLASGESIAVQPTHLDPAALVAHVISDGACDIAKLTPAHLEIADRLTDGDVEKHEKLNRFILGGEALSVKVAMSMQKKYPGLIIYNEYGPAETVVGCIVYRFIELEPGCASVLIGKPIANTRIYILDRHLNLVPLGQAGEICVSSPGVARGYLNKDEVTAKSFFPNPFVEGDRIYRTGDLARWLPDGNVEYMGRIDHQVKIRGHRIELGEIEAVLSRYEGINECIIVDRDDMSGRKHLAGYFTSEKKISVIDLKTFLKVKLPEYMIPARFTQLDALPLTPNGKVDRDALPDADTNRPDMETEYVAPEKEVEQIFADVWMAVLGLTRIGIHDNFFDLGGDSIISLQVVGKLKARGYEINPKDIFEHQTIAELVPIAEKETGIEAEQGPVAGKAPLTQIQKWFFDLALANPDQFNQSLLFEFSDGVDVSAMKISLQALIRHHDVLRARFSEENFECMPPDEPFLFVKKDVSGKTELDREISNLQSSLDIAKGIVFGAGLFRKDDIDYLLLVGHHLVVDGVSWRILLDDLISAYGTVLSGEAVVLPKKTTSFKDWAILVSAYAADHDFLKEISYWNEQFPTRIPALSGDHDFGDNDIASSDFLRVEIDKDETLNLLTEAQKAYNTEVNDLLLTALMRALTFWTDHDDIVFDLEGHGREDVIKGADISRTVGWFTSIFPVKLNPGKEADIAAQIKYVKETLRSIPDKGFNYGVIKYLKEGTSLSKMRPDILFNYLGQMSNVEAEGVRNLTDATRASASDSGNPRTHLIDINCKIEDARLFIDVGFSRNKFQKESIETLAGRVKQELLFVIAHCLDPESFDITPSDFSLADLDQEELDNIYD